MAKGQLFMMGFDGTSVTPHIQELIEKHHVGNILLTAKNLKCETFMFQTMRRYVSCSRTNPIQRQRILPSFVMSCRRSPTMLDIQYHYP